MSVEFPEPVVLCAEVIVQMQNFQVPAETADILRRGFPLQKIEVPDVQTGAEGLLSQRPNEREGLLRSTADSGGASPPNPVEGDRIFDRAPHAVLLQNGLERSEKFEIPRKVFRTEPPVIVGRRQVVGAVGHIGMIDEIGRAEICRAAHRRPLPPQELLIEELRRLCGNLF